MTQIPHKLYDDDDDGGGADDDQYKAW